MVAKSSQAHESLKQLKKKHHYVIRCLGPRCYSHGKENEITPIGRSRLTANASGEEGGKEAVRILLF